MMPKLTYNDVMTESKTRYDLAMISNGLKGEIPDKRFSFVRTLTEQEIESLTNANKILDELTATSPYKQFQDRYNGFFAIIEERNKKTVDGTFVQHELNDVYGKLDDLLSSLKGFEDRTKSLISSRFGKDSVQMNVFKAALSYEFDNSFEYRFSYNLRNYSQHKGSQIGEIKSVAKFVDGLPVADLEIILNGEKLLAEYSKWHSTVKKDLAEKSSDFALKPIIKKLKASCFLVYCKYLLSQEHEILGAIHKIKAIVGEYDVNLEAPTILKIHDGFSKTGGTMSLISIKTNLIETIEPLLRSAHHFVPKK